MKSLIIFSVAMVMLMFCQAVDSAIINLKREEQHIVKKRQASLSAQITAAASDGIITQSELETITGMDEVELNPLMLSADLDADGSINSQLEFNFLIVALELLSSGSLDIGDK